MKVLEADDVRDLLRRKCEEAGSQAAWARDNDVAEVVVGYVVNGDRAPTSPSIMRALGLRRVWVLDKANGHG